MLTSERSIRWLLAVAVGLAALGIWFFVLRGADQPADPYLEGSPDDPTTETTGSADAGSTDAADTSDDTSASTETTVEGSTVPFPFDPDGPGDPTRRPLEGFDEIALTVRRAASGELLEWCLLAALEQAQRNRGLMEVTDLQGYSGMAFVYPEDVSNGFWMRNTPTPLSIAWVDAQGQLVSTADMAPCDDVPTCPSYQPDGPYRVAIEVFQGGLDELGIEPGATIIVGGRCGPIEAG